jgi:hypothetical protein
VHGVDRAPDGERALGLGLWHVRSGRSYIFSAFL